MALTGDGLYHIVPSPNAPPEALSRNTLPLDLLSIDTDNYDVSMAFDHKDQGIHIYITPRSIGTTYYWHRS